MKNTVKFRDYLKKELKYPEFKKAFDEEEIYANIAIQIAKLRENNGYTQRDLAGLLHTTQQTVSRLENPENKSLSINTLIKLSQIFKKGLRIQFV